MQIRMQPVQQICTTPGMSPMPVKPITRLLVGQIEQRGIAKIVEGKIKLVPAVVSVDPLHPIVQTIQQFAVVDTIQLHRNSVNVPPAKVVIQLLLIQRLLTMRT